MNDLPLPEWLLRWLSVDVQSLEGGSADLRLARFPEGEWGLVALLVVVALCGIVVWIYSREGAVTRWRKGLMAAFRIGIVLALALVAFYPILEITRARDLRATTIVLLDDSLSMSIEDRYLGAPDRLDSLASFLGVAPDAARTTSRAAVIDQLLDANEQRFLKELRARNLLRVYTYSDELRPIGTSTEGSGPAAEPASGGAVPSVPASATDAGRNPPAGDPSSPAGDAASASVAVPAVDLVPRGPRTDLARAIRQAVESQGGGRVAAVVVIGDGRVTAGEGLGGVAEFLRQKEIEVHTIGVGDPSPSRNLRITAVLTSEKVFAGDPVHVEVRFRQKGYDNETIDIALADSLAVPGGATVEKTFEPSSVSLEEGQVEGSAHFDIELSGLGTHELTARIEPRPEELLADDNERTADVEVVEEATRVLLIAGAPSWEYRFVKNLLRRDRRVHVAAWLMSADPDYPQEGNASLERLPVDASELFEYDVVLLLDPDPEGLPPGYPELLERFVGKHRGGLLYMAGGLYTPRLVHSPSMDRLTGMLPVTIDPTRAAESGTEFREVAYPLVPTRAASGHAATKLSSRPERNRERWGELEGPYWSLPVAKVKPGATVLLGHADPRRTLDGEPIPVLAWQYYEGGRVMYIGFDESWRWRSTTLEVYDQFWIQTVRYLTETRLLGGRRQLLQTESEAYDLGDVVSVSALLVDEGYQPLEAEAVTATATDPDGDVTELRLERDATAPGWFRSVYVPRKLGEHVFRLEDGTELAVEVEVPDLEFQEPRLDEAALRELAERTGGAYRPVWEAAAVPGSIPDRRQTVVTQDEPIPLWDNWFSLSVLAGLLTIEWILRKWNRLL